MNTEEKKRLIFYYVFISAYKNCLIKHCAHFPLPVQLFKKCFLMPMVI